MSDDDFRRNLAAMDFEDTVYVTGSDGKTYIVVKRELGGTDRFYVYDLETGTENGARQTLTLEQLVAAYEPAPETPDVPEELPTEEVAEEPTTPEAGGGGGDETAAEPEQEAECATEAPVPIMESYDFGNQTVVKVDTVKLSTFGNTLVEKSAALTPKIEAVGTASQSITNGWQDSSTATFTTKFGSFVEGANKLPAEILAYGNYLSNLASEYESIQEDALTALGGGN